tara:strand:- start:1428 stop:1670 length:243 start_codon:yes stop_codon:yes gene_type:complete
MDDPTGGMWIYFIFFLIPLARILPRMIRKFKNKVPREQPEQFEEKPMWRPEPPKKERKPFFEEDTPNKDDGWLSKDDFKK